MACLTPGTRIATPTGEVPIDSLAVGDRVVTRDNGGQAIRWVGRRRLDAATLVAHPALRPVLIRSGALGRGLPERDMLVSPDTRLLALDSQPAPFLDAPDRFVAAKRLVDQAGILRVEASAVDYLLIGFDHQEVVLADGAWIESAWPGPVAPRGAAGAAWREMRRLFPEHAAVPEQGAAR